RGCAGQRFSRRHEPARAHSVRPLLHRELVAVVRLAHHCADGDPHFPESQRALSEDNRHMAELDTRAGASLTSPQNDTPSDSHDAAPPSSAATASGPRRDVLRAALIFLAVLLACALGCLAVVVPGAWFPRATPQTWPVKNLTLARGVGRVIGNELVVSAPDANDITLVTATTNLRSSDYPGIAWSVAN